MTSVPVSSCSAVVVMSEASLSDSDCEIAEPQSFSLSLSPESVEPFGWRIRTTRVLMEHRKKHRRHPEGRLCRPRHSRACSRQLRPCVCKRRWRTRKAAVVRWNTKANIGGRLVVERSSREWSSRRTRMTT